MCEKVNKKGYNQNGTKEWREERQGGGGEYREGGREGRDEAE